VNQRIFTVALVLLLGVALAAVVSRPDDTPRFPAPPEVFEQGNLDEATVPATIVGSGGAALALENAIIPNQESVAVVNGKAISTAEYQEELARALESVTMQYGLDWNDPQNLAYLPTFQQQILEQLIDRALIAQFADEQGVVVDPADVEAEVATVQAQVQADPSIPDWESFLAAYNLTEESVREFITYELLVDALAENLGPAPEVVHVNASHILVETEELAQEILDRLNAGEDFAALAAEFSIDPGSAPNGGALGWFPPGVMVPEFESAAFSLNPGDISGLVRSDFGYHIILVHEKEARPLDPSLAGQMDQQRFQAWFEAQKASAVIEFLYTFDESAPAP
jgi:foldase protein PrsA